MGNSNGDLGNTSTFFNDNIPKDNCLIEVNGVLDSVMAQLDKVIYLLITLNTQRTHILTNIEIREKLRYVGGEVAGLKNKSITDKDTEILDVLIKQLDREIKEFVNFKTLISIEINELRVRVRKLERIITPYLKIGIISGSTYKYINRLSKYYFMLAVQFNNYKVGE